MTNATLPGLPLFGIAAQPLWKKLGFASEQAYEAWLASTQTANAQTAANPGNTVGVPPPPPGPSVGVPPAPPAPATPTGETYGPPVPVASPFSSGAVAAPASSVTPAQSAPAPAANATAGFTGPGEAYTPPPSETLLQKYGDLVGLHHPAVAPTISQLYAPGEAASNAAGNFVQSQIGRTSPAQTSGESLPNRLKDLVGLHKPTVAPTIGDLIQGGSAAGKIAGAGVRAVTNPVNVGLSGAAIPAEGGNIAASLGRNAAANFLMGSSSQGAKEAGAPPIVQTGAGIASGIVPGLVEGGIKNIVSNIVKGGGEETAATIKQKAAAALGRELTSDEAQYIDALPKDRLGNLAKEIPAASTSDIPGLEASAAMTPEQLRATQQAATEATTRTGGQLKAEATALGIPTVDANGRALSNAKMIDAIDRYKLGRTASQNAQKAAQRVRSGAPVPVGTGSLDTTLAEMGHTPGTTPTLPSSKGPATATPTLSRDLQGAKPRYNYGTQGAFTPAFASDVEKAAFITAQATKSKRDADYLKFVMDATGMSERDARAYGQQVRNGVKAAAKDAIANGQTDGTLIVPSVQPPNAIAARVPNVAPPAPENVVPINIRPQSGPSAAEPVTAASGAPPIPPSRTLPLGTSGGGDLPRNLQGIGGGSEFDDIVNKFRTDFGRQAEVLPTNVSPIRSVTSKIGGDIADPFQNALVQNERQLSEQLAQQQMRALGVDQKISSMVNTEGLTADEIRGLSVDAETAIQEAKNRVNQGVKAFREDAIKTRYPAGPERSAALAAMSRRDAQLAAQKTNVFDKAENVLKEVRFGADVGTILQQDLAAVRRGGTSIATGLLGRLTDKIRQGLGTDPASLGVYFDQNVSPAVQRASDGFIETGARGAGLERNLYPAAEAPSLANKVLTAPVRAVRAVNNAQYGVVEKLGQLAYEGQLYQAKALGMDITDPLVRKQAGAFGNLVRSTAQTATDPGRALVEKRLLLSAPLSRSQFTEIATPLRALHSPMEALNAANLIASTAATFGMAYEINNLLGQPLSLHDFLNTVANPLSPGFGQLTLKATDDSGKHMKWNFLPQYSLENAVLRSVRATTDAAKGDKSAGDALKAIGDAAARYGVGRTNVIPGQALNAAGFGYGFTSGFHYGDMPLKERALNQIPIPLSASQALTQGTTPLKSPVGFGLNITGGNTYAESQYSLMDRLAQKTYNTSYFSLTPELQAQLNVQAGQEGETVDDATRAGPYQYASNSALTAVKLKTQNDPAFQQKQQQFLATLGMTNYDVTKYKTMGPAHTSFVNRAQTLGASKAQAEGAWQDFRNNVLGIDKITRSMQEDAIKADPSIVDALNALYENGQETYPPPQWALDLASQAKTPALQPTR